MELSGRGGGIMCGANERKREIERKDRGGGEIKKKSKVDEGRRSASNSVDNPIVDENEVELFNLLGGQHLVIDEHAVHWLLESRAGGNLRG